MVIRVKIKSRGLFLIGLSLLLVLSFVSLHGRQATGSDQASLGFSLGEVLLRWRLVSSGVVTPESQSGEEELTGALNRLKSSLKDTGFPQKAVNRVKPLGDKLSAAKSRSLWSIQLGYWSFRQVGSSVVLSGTEIGSISEEARSQSYPFLEFPDGGARATVDITEKSLKTGSENFTVELWVNPVDNVSGTLLEISDWSLVLRDNGLVVELPQGSVSGTELTANTWTHVALVTNGEKVTVYQNGLKSVESELSDPLETAGKLELGGGFVGKLDELRLRSKVISPAGISFDRPLDYLLGFPVISWVNENFESGDQWNFYAGFLVSSLAVKSSSEVAAVQPKNLSDASEFLLGKIEDVPRPPEGLPASVVDEIRQLGKLGKNDELSDANKSKVDEILAELINYLGLS